MVTPDGDKEAAAEGSRPGQSAHDDPQGSEEGVEGQEDVAGQVSGTERGHEGEARRREALGAFLDERVAEGFRVESRTDTQAIIAPARSRLSFLDRLRKSDTIERRVVSVDVDGNVTTSPAQPLRS